MSRVKSLTLILFLLCTGVSKTDASSPAKVKDTLVIENIIPFQQQHCHGSTLVELPNKDLLCA
ncbi:MAG TPA: hypothetical protein VN249_01085, partial [Prolixibacteraceae bacterium]|nr:hypothetical protein [Prolixibacteraceae bacterium]